MSCDGPRAEVSRRVASRLFRGNEDNQMWRDFFASQLGEIKSESQGGVRCEIFGLLAVSYRINFPRGHGSFQTANLSPSPNGTKAYILSLQSVPITQCGEIVRDPYVRS